MVLSSRARLLRLRTLLFALSLPVPIEQKPNLIESSRGDLSATGESWPMQNEPNTVELDEAARSWSQSRYLKLSKEKGKESWIVTWKRTGTPFGRIWKPGIEMAGREQWKCEREIGSGCPDLYWSKEEALLYLRSLNFKAAAARERASRA